MMNHDWNDRFEALYRKHYGWVFRYFHQYRIADGEAADLAQETFLKAWKNIEGNRGDGDATYLRKTARSVLLYRIRQADAAKRRGRLESIDDPDFREEALPEVRPDFAERDELERRKAALHAALAELPDGQRIALELQLQDLSLKEIANALHTTVDAVKSRQRDGRKALRERLGVELPEDDQ